MFYVYFLFFMVIPAGWINKMQEIINITLTFLNLTP